MEDEVMDYADEPEAAIEGKTDAEISEDEGPVGLDDDDNNETGQDEAVEAEADGDAAEEWAEIEVNGKKYQVPAELRDGYLMHGDYTRKTQGVAEERRQVEEFAKRVQAQAQATEEELNLRAELINVTSQLKGYEKVDWRQLDAEDPVRAQAAWREYSILKERATSLSQNYQHVVHERTEAAQRSAAERFQQTRAFAEKEIPGWTPEVDQKVTEFALQHFNEAELVQSMNPQIYRMLHLAYLGSQTLQRASAKPSAALKPVQVKPLSKVTGKSSGGVTKDPSEMSMDEYAKYMNAKERKRA